MPFERLQLLQNLRSRYFLMTWLIEDRANALLMRLDLKVFKSFLSWKELRLLQILTT